MTNQKQKFIVLVEHFPQKAHELAESRGVSLGRLRSLIFEGVYYIDDNCDLIESPVGRAAYELKEAAKEFFCIEKIAIIKNTMNTFSQLSRMPKIKGRVTK